MRVRYHRIRRKVVRTADGRRVGRVNDVVAEAEGDELFVTTLLVGPGGLVRRLGFKGRWVLEELRPARIPWRLVAEIDDEIRLLVDHDELRAQLAGEQEVEPRRRERTA